MGDKGVYKGFENKFRLYADLNIDYPNEELALALNIPAPEDRQPDLQYFTSVFVSSGFNLNSAFFLPSELITAKDSVTDKPLDVEHEQDKIVGHLYSKVFAYKDRTIFEPQEVLETLGTDVEKVSMDIITASRLYKARFPEIAMAVESGDYKVSMECYYRDYDIIVDNIIIPKLEAHSLGLAETVNSVIPVVEGNKSLGDHRVGRVLRGILFSGCGLVEKPANPDSVILETAAQNNNSYILDLTKVDSYMKAKKEQETIVIHSLEGVQKDKAFLSGAFGGSHRHDVSMDKKESFLDGSHTHLILPDNLPDGVAVYFVDDGGHRHPVKGAILGSEKGHTHKFYVEDGSAGFKVYESGPSVSAHKHEVVEVDVDQDYDLNIKKASSSGSTSYGGVHHHFVEFGDGIKLKTVTPSDIIKMEEAMSDKKNRDVAGTGHVDGSPMSKPDICVSYKRYVYKKGGDDPGAPANADKTPGLVPQVESYPAPTGGGAGDIVTQQDEIAYENWCVLFDVACTTPGGVAVHPDCLRLVLDRTTRETISNYYEKLQENRKKSGIDKALSSLSEVLEKAKAFEGPKKEET